MLAWQLCDFQGIQTTFAKKPYIFAIFHGVWTSCPPLDPHMADNNYQALEMSQPVLAAAHRGFFSNDGFAGLEGGKIYS